MACDARRRHGDGTAASGCHVRQYMCRCGSGKEQRQGVDSSAVCGGQSTMSTAVGFIPTLALERGSATTRFTYCSYTLLHPLLLGSSSPMTMMHKSIMDGASRIHSIGELLIER